MDGMGTEWDNMYERPLGRVVVVVVAYTLALALLLPMLLLLVVVGAYRRCSSSFTASLYVNCSCHRRLHHSLSTTICSIHRHLVFVVASRCRCFASRTRLSLLRLQPVVHSTVSKQYRLVHSNPCCHNSNLTPRCSLTLLSALLCATPLPVAVVSVPSVPVVFSGWIDSAAAAPGLDPAAMSFSPYSQPAQGITIQPPVTVTTTNKPLTHTSTTTIGIRSPITTTSSTTTGSSSFGLRPSHVFIPPKYANIAKNSKDLFKKKFDYIHTLKTTHRSVSNNGVSFESGVQSTNATAAVRGYVKASAASVYGYTVEGEANTDAGADTKATIKSASLYPGLTVSATAASNKSGINYTGEVEFVHDAFTVTGEVKSDLSKHAAKVSVSAGYDGIAIGGIVATDLTNGADVTDYNVGLEYIQPTYVASLYTEQQAETATVSYYQRVSQQHAVAAAVKVNIAGDKSAVLTLGTDYVLDATTSVKAKVEVPSALVSVALEHRLKSPSVLLGLAAAYNPLSFQKQVKAEQFGVTLQFGDY